VTVGWPIPSDLLAFAATIALGAVIGLELHSYRRGQGTELGFGTTRTITLIATAGFVLWRLGPVPYAVGLAGILALLGLAYRARLPGEASLLPTMVGLLGALLGPLTLTTPPVLVAAVTVVILLGLGESSSIRRLSDAFPAEEGVTVAKFIVLAGLILPLLPNTEIPGIAGITYVKIWAAVLVISGISYASYLAHRYLAPGAGLLLTGILGGLYSSTAATVVIARGVQRDPSPQAAAAIIAATAMMYLRLLAVIAALGHVDIALTLAPPFGIAILGSALVAFLLLWRAGHEQKAAGVPAPQNPLDLPVAFLFAGLFVVFAVVTQYVTGHFGAAGLHVLSFLVGFSDIDPFVLSLLAGKFAVTPAAVIGAVLIATGANNLLKSVYALFLSRSRAVLPAAAWLTALTIGSIALALA
jgi:uncharacterized membrane protein (DUF4010 family)